MNNLIVSYDLRFHRNYDRIYAVLDYMGENCQILESVFYLKTHYSAIECRDMLQKYADSDDGIAVFDCSNNTWATYNCNPKSIEEVVKPLWYK